MTALASPSRICFRGSRSARWAGVMGRRIMSTYFAAASRSASSPARASFWRCSGVGRQTARTMWYSERRIGRNCCMYWRAWASLLATLTTIAALILTAFTAPGAARLVATTRGAGAALRTLTGCSPAFAGAPPTVLTSTISVTIPGAAGATFTSIVIFGTATPAGGAGTGFAGAEGPAARVGLAEPFERQGRGHRRDRDDEGHCCGGNPVDHRRASSTVRFTP